MHAATGEGMTALMAAAATGQAKVLEVLLEAGADPQASGNNGASASPPHLPHISPYLPAGVRQ